MVSTSQLNSCSIFGAKLTLEFAQDNVFSVNSRLVKKTGGCPMGVDQNLLYSEIFMYVKWKKT